jgi:phosphatidate cytidylyltransferase
MFELNPHLLWAVAAMFVALTGGTLVRIVALRGAVSDLAASRLGSLRTWWILACLLSVAVICGERGVLVLLAVASALSLQEFVRLIGWDVAGRPTVIAVFAVLPVYYLLALAGWLDLLRQTAPVVFLVSLGGMRACLGNTQAYVRTTVAMFWGLMLIVYCLSHAAMSLEISTVAQPLTGRVGWFLFLILLTETNDIMQAITGRRCGKTKITPRVSPNKSLQGLLGGMTSTVALAVISAPWLTSLTLGRSVGMGLCLSVAAGLLISVFGFLGDINMSSVKRDVGVKDASQLLPGQGGMIDRINSLTFTAPMFYYFVRMVSQPF